MLFVQRKDWVLVSQSLPEGLWRLSVYQCQPHRKIDGIGSLLHLIIIIFAFLKTVVQRDYTQNVDGVGIRDSLRMAYSSHLSFSSGAESSC